MNIRDKIRNYRPVRRNEKSTREPLTAEEKRKIKARMDVFDELRRQGKNPYEMPAAEVRALVKERQKEQQA